MPSRTHAAAAALTCLAGQCLLVSNAAPLSGDIDALMAELKGFKVSTGGAKQARFPLGVFTSRAASARSRVWRRLSDAP